MKLLRAEFSKERINAFITINLIIFAATENGIVPSISGYTVIAVFAIDNIVSALSIFRIAVLRSRILFDKASGNGLLKTPINPTGRCCTMRNKKPRENLIRWRSEHLPILINKWVKIVYRCWKIKTRYDESKYLKALKEKNPFLLVQKVLVK